MSADLNVNNYTISELLAILELDDPTNSEIIDKFYLTLFFTTKNISVYSFHYFVFSFEGTLINPPKALSIILNIYLSESKVKSFMPNL